MTLFTGGRYLSKDGSVVRTIERVQGDDIHWRDHIGPGRCSKDNFDRWAGSLSPDSPEPPKDQKRAKPVTQAVKEAIRKELAAVRNLRASLGDVRITTADVERDALIGVGLWQLDTTLKHMEAETVRGNSKPLRKVTAIDRHAALLQSGIFALVDLAGVHPRSIFKSSRDAAIAGFSRRLRDACSYSIDPSTLFKPAIKLGLPQLSHLLALITNRAASA